LYLFIYIYLNAHSHRQHSPTRATIQELSVFIRHPEPLLWPWTQDIRCSHEPTRSWFCLYEPPCS